MWEAALTGWSAVLRLAALALVLLPADLRSCPRLCQWQQARSAHPGAERLPCPPVLALGWAAAEAAQHSQVAATLRRQLTAVPGVQRQGRAQKPSHRPSRACRQAVLAAALGLTSPEAGLGSALERSLRALLRVAPGLAATLVVAAAAGLRGLQLLQPAG